MARISTRTTNLSYECALMSKGLNQSSSKVVDYYAWQCHNCQHVHDMFASQCHNCGYFKPSMSKAIVAESIHYSKVFIIDEDEDEDNREHDSHQVQDRSHQEDDSTWTTDDHQANKIDETQNLTQQEESLDRLLTIWSKAKDKRTDLNVDQKLHLYESLLDYFLHSQNRATQKRYWQLLHVQYKSKSMRHLTFMWFLGICTGLAFYYALDAMRSL
jgi:hypothetical protein